MEKETIAFVYKWTEISTGKWYIGVRYRKGCHPNDGYICSSKIVKPLILANPTEWIREIIATGIPEDMIALEIEILQSLDARRDPMSYNQHNNNGKSYNPGIKRSDETCAKISAAHKGKKHKPHSEEAKAKISAARKGKKISDETRAKMSAAKKNISDETRAKMSAASKRKSFSDEYRAKISAANKGRISPNKGKKLSDETRAKMSAASKGKPKSAEHYAKIRATRKKRNSQNNSQNTEK